MILFGFFLNLNVYGQLDAKTSLLVKESFLEDRFPGEQIISATSDRFGLIWAITDAGIFRFDGTKVIPFNIQNQHPFFEIKEFGNNLVLISKYEVIQVNLDDLSTETLYSVPTKSDWQIDGADGMVTLAISTTDVKTGMRQIHTMNSGGKRPESKAFRSSGILHGLVAFDSMVVVISDQVNVVSFVTNQVVKSFEMHTNLGLDTNTNYSKIGTNTIAVTNHSSKTIYTYNVLTGDLDSIWCDQNLTHLSRYNHSSFVGYNLTGIGSFQLISTPNQTKLVQNEWGKYDIEVQKPYEADILKFGKSFWRLSTNRILTLSFQREAFNLLQPINSDGTPNQVSIKQTAYPELGDYYFSATIPALLKIEKKTNRIVKEIPFRNDGKSNVIFGSMDYRDSILVYSSHGIFLMNKKNCGYKVLLNQEVNYSGIGSYDANNSEFYYNGIKPTKDGVWVGSKNNLLYYYSHVTGKVSAFEILENNDYVRKDNLIYEMEELPNGSVFVLCKLGVFFKSATDKKFQRADLKFKSLVFKPGVSLSSILYTNNNKLTFSSFSHGMFVYDLAKDTLYQPYHLFYKRPDISDIWLDKKGLVWGASRDGLVLFDQKLNLVKVFNEKQGMPMHNLHYHYFGIDAQNHLVIGVGGGVLRVNTNLLIAENQSANFYIGNLMVNGSQYGHPMSILNGQHGQFKSTENSINFNIFSDNIFDATTKSYVIKLEGWDSDWRFPSDYEQISYQNLKPGRYKLRVKSLEAGKENEAIYEFTIRRPVYETWWFLSLVALFIASIITAFVRYRFEYIRREAALEQSYEKRLLKLETESLRAQMNPHFIFNSLNSIKSFIIDNERVLATQYLNKFSSLIRLILNSTTKSINDLESELLSLTYYIELEELRFRNKFKHQIEVQLIHDATEIFIPPMLIQPHVENAIWHGLLHNEMPGFLKVSVKEEAGCLLVVIEDNGVGRAKSKELGSKSATVYKSMGMDITQSRLNLINENEMGTEIEDLMDVDGKPIGTRISLRITCFNQDGERLRNEL